MAEEKKVKESEVKKTGLTRAEKKSIEAKKTGKIAIVRIRGRKDVKSKTEDTLTLLNLKRSNWMTVVERTPVYMGMVMKAKDYITWGEVDDAVFTKLVEKWGRKAGDKKLSKKEADEFSKKFFSGGITFREAGVDPALRLHPPSGGFKKAGIKKTIKIGGALGYRGAKINDLLIKMGGLKEKGSKEEK